MTGRLAERRAALVTLSIAQRARLSDQFSPVARNLATVDRVTSGLRSHPIPAACAVGALSLLGPRRLLRWSLRLAPLYALLAAFYPRA
jgi:hypothetical protein